MTFLAVEFNSFGEVIMLHANASRMRNMRMRSSKLFSILVETLKLTPMYCPSTNSWGTSTKSLCIRSRISNWFTWLMNTSRSSNLSMSVFKIFFTVWHLAYGIEQLPCSSCRERFCPHLGLDNSARRKEKRYEKKCQLGSGVREIVNFTKF